MTRTGITSGTRLLGYVQLRVGERVFALPVQAAHFDADSSTTPGGFFDEGGELGILVDDDASDASVRAQIAVASEEAARYIGKRFLN